MAPDIYERLFLYARQLERCFEGEPSFQSSDKPRQAHRATSDGAMATAEAQR